MTVAEANPFAHIKAYERDEFERLGRYLEVLEVMRFVAGRHFVPGTRPELKVVKSTAQDLANLRRAFR